MKQWYFIDILNQQRGPILEIDLVRLYNEGMIIPDTTLVWNQEMTNWQPIGDLFNQLNLPHSVPDDLLKYDEITKKLRQTKMISDILAKPYSSYRDILLENMFKVINSTYSTDYHTYFHIIREEIYKDNPNPFAIYMLPIALNDRVSVDMESIFLTKKLIKIIWIQLNYPAAMMDLFYPYRINVRPFEKKRFSLFPGTKDKRRYHLHNEMHKVLDNFFETKYSDLQLSIGLAAINPLGAWLNRQFFYALLTNSLFCEKYMNMTVPQVIMANKWTKSLNDKTSSSHFFLKWTRRAAENKNIKAMAILGFFYYAINKKHDAKLWLKKAAEQGNEAAQYLLMRMDS